MPTYLQGGEQTTVNSTITELFPAIAFNSKKKITTAEEMQDFITEAKLTSQNAKKSFVNDSNIKSAEKYITMMESIRPSMRTTKLENAVGIKKWLDEYSHQRLIDKVVWGYREKPQGVPENHAGDIFVYFKDKTTLPKILGVSLKAGTEKSKEPKMNSYVGSSLRKPCFMDYFPKALPQLKDELWDKVYSKVPNLPKEVTKQNYLTLTTNRQTPHPILKEKVLLMFKYQNRMFEELYKEMNLVCRNKFISMINSNTYGLNLTKRWIMEEFNLPKDNAEVPLVLVKAVGIKAEAQLASVKDFLPAVSKVKAYLKINSVQEWFIDLMGDNNHKLTLLMTIRSDSEYREQKQKGKLGAYTMLKLLYRGAK